MATDNNQFRLKLTPSTYYHFVVDWGDGAREMFTGTTAATEASAGLTHIYAQPGIYNVQIRELSSGGFPSIYYNGNSNGSWYVDDTKIRRVNSWGEVSWKTLNSAFEGCSNLSAVDTNSSKLSAIVDISTAFHSCASLSGIAPDFKEISGTGMFNAFYNCQNLDSVPYIETSGCTTFANAFYNCHDLVIIPTFNTSNVSNFTGTWSGCSNLSAFPQIDTLCATTFLQTWQNCSNLSSFPVLSSQGVTDLTLAWSGCSKLSSFPSLTTNNVSNFNGTWNGCSNLSSFPVLNTLSGISFGSANNIAGTWQDCSNLKTFPVLSTHGGQTFDATWRGCSNLATFPSLSVLNGTSFYTTWTDCYGLTSFPPLNTGKSTNFDYTWAGCSKLSSFPLINTGSGTSFNGTWQDCGSLGLNPASRIFPSINTINAISMMSTWERCSAMGWFPPISTGNVTDFSSAWSDCTNLSSFPLLNTGSGTSFFYTWYNCPRLSANPFPQLNLNNMTIGGNAFGGTTKLQTQSFSALLTALSSGNFNTSVNFTGGKSRYNRGALSAVLTLTNNRNWYFSSDGYEPSVSNGTTDWTASASLTSNAAIAYKHIQYQNSYPYSGAFFALASAANMVPYSYSSTGTTGWTHNQITSVTNGSLPSPVRSVAATYVTNQNVFTILTEDGYAITSNNDVTNSTWLESVNLGVSADGPWVDITSVSVPINISPYGYLTFAICAGTIVARTGDGNINSYTLPVSQKWNNIECRPAESAFFTPTIIAVGNGQYCARSTDYGVTWTAISMPTNQNWRSVQYGLCEDGYYRWVAVSSGATAGTAAAYSEDDGVTWTSTALPAAGTWLSVAYGDKTFVAVNGGTSAAYSINGKTWTAITLPTNSTATEVTYGNGRFVTIPNSYSASYVAYAPDTPV